MEKVAELMENIIDDVNKEDSAILSTYGKILQNIFKIILWLGVPFLFYIIMSMNL